MRKQLSEPFINFPQYKFHQRKSQRSYNFFVTPYIKHQQLHKNTSQQSSKYQDSNTLYQGKEEFSNDQQLIDNNKSFNQLTFPQLIKLTKQSCRRTIQQDSNKLRNQIWLRVQIFFRQVQQYCNNFFQNLQQALQEPNQYINYQKGYKTDRISLKRHLVQSFKNNNSIYNSQKMSKIILKIIKKIEQYFQYSRMNSLKQLFSIPLVKKQKTSKEMKQKSYSTQKQIDNKNTFTLNKKNRQKYFEMMYNNIARNQQIGRNQQNDNSYGLQSRFYQSNRNAQEQSIENSIISAITKKNNRYQKFHEYQSGQIPYNMNQTPLSKQRVRQSTKNSRVNKKDKSIDRITMSPIINRVAASTQFILNDQYSHSVSDPRYFSASIRQKQKKNQITNQNKQKSKVKYWVVNGNTSAIFDWCQQISINPNVKTIMVPPTYNINNQQVNINNKDQNIRKKARIFTCICFCNEQEVIAVGSTDQIIYIFRKNQSLDASSFQNSKPYAKMVTKLVGHTSAVCCLFEQNRILFSGGDVPCCSIILWNTQNWTIRSKINYHSAAICSIVGIPNTNYIISSGFDRNMKLYDYSRSLVSEYSEKISVIFTKILYYEHLQKVVAVSPSTSLLILRLSMSSDPFSLSFNKDVQCESKITNAEKSITKQTSLLVVGLQNGSIQIYNVKQFNKINKLTINIGSILNMIIFSRNNKNESPLLLCLCHGSKTLFIVNTQTEYIAKYNVKQNFDIKAVQGMGPIMILGSSNQIAWVSQNFDNSKILMGQFDIY